jgi:hypothetical protein
LLAGGIVVPRRRLPLRIGQRSAEPVVLEVIRLRLKSQAEPS